MIDFKNVQVSNVALMAVYEQARRVLRFYGVDKVRMGDALTDLDTAVQRVMSIAPSGDTTAIDLIDDYLFLTEEQQLVIRRMAETYKGSNKLDGLLI